MNSHDFGNLIYLKLGPCRVTNATDDPTFFKKSWNSNANVFFVDQPIGVGFSYAEHGQSVVCDVFMCFRRSIFLITVHRVLPRKQPGILLCSLQSSSRIFPHLKGAPSIWQANHTVYVPIYYLYIDPAEGPTRRDGISHSLLLRSMTRTPCS